jgi:hypothetical protein
MTFKMGGADFVLQQPLDNFGEFMSEPFVERLKNITSSVITETRNTDTFPIKHLDYWRM